MESSSISSSPKPSLTPSEEATRLATLMNSALAGTFSSASTTAGDSAIRPQLRHAGRTPVQLLVFPPGRGYPFLDSPAHRALGIPGRAPGAARELDRPRAQLGDLLTPGPPGQKGAHRDSQREPHDQSPAEPAAPLVIIHPIVLHLRPSETPPRASRRSPAGARAPPWARTSPPRARTLRAWRPRTVTP